MQLVQSCLRDHWAKYSLHSVLYHTSHFEKETKNRNNNTCSLDIIIQTISVVMVQYAREALKQDRQQ
jgi:hypothetical protein